MPWPLRMITYASVLLLICLIYFGYRYFRSINRADLQPAGLYKSFFWVLAVLFFSYPVAGHIQFWVTGSFSRTGFPDLLIYMFWYGVISMGVMLNWLLLHDLLRPFALRFTGRDLTTVKRDFAKAFLIVSLLSMIYSAGKMVWDTYRITIEQVNYTLPPGNEIPDSLTIVHIADLHADQYTGVADLNRYIQKVNEAKPDIVIFAGDLITSGRDYIVAGAEALQKIESAYGVYFVMGDHDYWTGTEPISEALTERGINVLQNENAWIDHRGALIKISGITELYSNRVSAEVLDQLMDDNRGEKLSILAAHQASERLVGKSLDKGVNLLLTGHTHGGQMRIPIFFYPVTAARAETPYVNGNWKLGDYLLLNVNNGLGFTLSPVRYNAPAGVSIIRVENQF